MDRIVAICGLRCDGCPAYQATINDDDDMRRKTAENWSKEFNVDIEPESINCLGCLSEKEPIFHHCTVCEIRKCGKDREVLNCAHCDDYACEKLTKFFDMVPDAKKTLDEIRQGL